MNIVWASQTHKVKEQLQSEIQETQKQILRLTKKELRLWESYRDLVQANTIKEKSK
jgi:hypothetical protein